MKKALRMLIIAMFLIATFSVAANAALTEKQQKALMDYTEKFVNEGNQAGVIQYGSRNAWNCLQMKLEYIDRCFYTVGNTSTRMFWMLKPEGYPNAAEAQKDIDNNYVRPGNYIVLGCAEFVDFMYRGALGFNFDYYIANHFSAWTTAIFTQDNYADWRVVLDKDGNRLPLFEVILDLNRDPGYSLHTVFADEELLARMQPGDIIVGRNAASDLGHIMLYAGDGWIYEASSTVFPELDGTAIGYLIHKRSLSVMDMGTWYNTLQVLRISDGVLDEDFEGYPMNIDFKSLNSTESAIDKKAPYITDVTCSDTANANGQFTVRVDASDVYGDGRVLVQASDPTVVVRGSSQYESGVFGFFVSKLSKLPNNPAWVSKKSTAHEFRKTPGSYSLWVKDAAGNVSDRYVVNIAENGSVTITAASGDVVASTTEYTYPAFEKAPSIRNFIKKNSYSVGIFRDVAEEQWFAPYAKGTFEFGLMLGTYDGTTFEPNKEITVNELITLAARVHNIYYGGSGIFAQGDPWYEIYMRYAVHNGIITNGEFTDRSRTATRTEMAYLFAKILPKKEYQEINTVTRLPDVDENSEHADSIFLLYRAGLVAGTDPSGTFEPNKTVTRAEVAAIITRLVDPAKRKGFRYV